MNTNTLKREFEVLPGSQEPLGATVKDGGINFAVVSGAADVQLLLYETESDVKPYATLKMQRTGNVWHLFVPGLKDPVLYAFSVDGEFSPKVTGNRFHADVPLIDPYAVEVAANDDSWEAPVTYANDNREDPERHTRKGSVGELAIVPKSVALKSDDFDWQGDRAPNTPMVESVIYECHLRGFTAHKSSPVIAKRGSYLAFIEMIPHLVELGITAVELMPIMESYRKTPFRNPKTGRANKNAWAYNTLAFKAPDAGLTASGKIGAARTELKQLVRALHKAGIEVFLDIVFNHSPEMHEFGPSICFRGMDNRLYYLLVPGQPELYKNYTGCGNTLSCNDPVVMQLIIDVLRYWVEEYHVDGFRFDLASIFAIEKDLSINPHAPVVKAITEDAVLSKVKLIFEPWAPADGLYLLGRFPAPVSEWNDKFRDTVRDFVRAVSGQVANLGTRLAGSQDLFGSDGRRHSVNIVTVHDGFTLMDLVSYDMKHNEANGEENRDGENNNRSWNCGYEGDVSTANIPEEEKQRIMRLRKQQIKNFLTLLFMARGTPIFLYGDEMGRSNGGNNNAYCQPELNELDWDLLKQHPDLFRFAKTIIAFRKRHYVGGRGHNPVFRPITWHGVEPFKPDWSEWTRFIAWQLEPFNAEGVEPGSAIYIASNAYWETIKVKLPEGKWHRIVDTSLPQGEDIVADDAVPVTITGSEYIINPRSSIVLVRDDGK